MDCEQVVKEEVTEKYLLGHLTEAEQGAFEVHFFECQRCFEEVQTLRALQTELRRAAPAIRADLKIALEELKEKSEPKSGVPGIVAPLTRLRKHRVSRWVGTTALLGLAVVIGYTVWFHLARRTTEPVRPLTTYPGQELQSTFSPDGTQVAFSWTGPNQDNFDIYVKIIDTEPPTRLTSDSAKDYCPVWSPDGRWIAFLRELSDEEAQVVLVPPLPGPERKVGRIQIDTNHHIASAPAWSPDSKFLIISDKSSSGEREPYSLFLLSIDKPEKKLKLTKPPTSSWGDTYPALSPDGRNLVFSRWAQSLINDLYLLTLSESLEPLAERRLTFDNQMASSPVWTVDGQDIIYASAQDSGASLRRIAPNRSAPPVPLTSFGQNGAYPALSRQGHRLSYSQSDSNIWRLEVSDPTGKPFISSTRGMTYPSSHLTVGGLLLNLAAPATMRSGCAIAMVQASNS
jgi:Tol biopolymer transport system component